MATKDTKSINDVQQRKMLTNPIPGLVLSLAVPTILSMLVTALYNTADTFFVSQLGTSASGAVGITFSLMAIGQAVAFSLGMGASAFISRKLGANDVTSANMYASTSFFTCAALALILSVSGLAFLDKLMIMLGSTPTILPYAKSYASYILLGTPIMCTSFVMNNILRSEGMARFAMCGLVSGGLINIALDPIFIFTFKLGIAGAAIATLISQCISFSILLSFFIRGKSTAHINIRCVSRDIRVYWNILSCGFPSLCRQGLASVSTVALNVTAAVYGDAAVAAMSIVTRIFMFLLSVMLGLGQGLMPVIGYNYGAMNYSRVKQAFWFTVTLGMAAMGTMATICFIFAPQIIESFRDDAAVISIGVPAMRYQCIALLLQPLFMCTNMMHQTTGFAGRATFLACNRQGIYFLPLIIILPSLFKLQGVQITQPLSDLLSFLTAIPFVYTFMLHLNDKAKARA